MDRAAEERVDDPEPMPGAAGTPNGGQAGWLPQQPWMPYPQQAVQQYPQQAVQPYPQQAVQPYPQQAVQPYPQQAVQLGPQAVQPAGYSPQAVQPGYPQRAVPPYSQQAAVQPYPQQVPQAPTAYQQPQSPVLFHHQPQQPSFFGSPAGVGLANSCYLPSTPPAPGPFSNLRSQRVPRVTLPWERRERAGRPNAVETALRNLYEMGLIQPSPSAQPQQLQPQHGQGYFQPSYFGPLAPPQLAHQQAAVVQPQQAGAAVLQPQVAAAFIRPQVATVVLQQQASGAPPSVASPSAASPSVASPSVASPSVAAPSVAAPSVAAPSGPAAPSSATQPLMCSVCRSERPDGVLRCGHAICHTCFTEQLAVKRECPDPRCGRVFDANSFNPIQRS